MAVLEINRNDLKWKLIGPMDPICTRQEPMKPILFCYWDPSQHEKWMPLSPNWDRLPLWRNFQNGRQRSEITFLLITPHLGYIETRFWFLDPCFSGIQWWHWKINMTLGYLLVNSEFKMAVLEININDINWFMGPMDPTCTHQERMKHILFCY